MARALGRAAPSGRRRGSFVCGGSAPGANLSPARHVGARGRLRDRARGEKLDLCHGKRKNPELPEWLEGSYLSAIRELAEIGIRQLPGVQDQLDLRGILGIVALHKDARAYARFLLSFSEDELLDMESEATGRT